MGELTGEAAQGLKTRQVGSDEPADLIASGNYGPFVLDPPPTYCVDSHVWFLAFIYTEQFMIPRGRGKQTSLSPTDSLSQQHLTSRRQGSRTHGPPSTGIN